MWYLIFLAVTGLLSFGLAFCAWGHRDYTGLCEWCAYFIFAIPVFMIFRKRRESSFLVISKIVIIFGAVLLPLAGGMFFRSGVIPGMDFNIIPLLFLVSGMVIMATIFRRGIFNATPLPRSQIISLMKDGVVVLDPSGRIIDMNTSAQNMMEMRESAVIGKSAKEVFARWSEDLQNFFDEEEAQTEIRIKTTPPQYFDLSLEPVCDRNGKVTNRLVILHDVTKRNSVEIALLKSEERYRNLFSMMKEGFSIIEIVFDLAGKPIDYRFLEVNGAFEDQTGLFNVQGKLMRELVPDHEDFWFQKYGKIAMSGTPARFVHYARALGRWYDVYAYRVGVPEHRQVAVVFNDISARKHNEEVLVRKEAELREAERVAHLGSWYWDAKTRVLTGTDGFWALYGINKTREPKPSFHEMKGEYYPISEWERLRFAVIGTLRSGVGYELDLRAFRNGQPIWIATRSEVVRGGSGEIIGLRGIEQDITDRKRSEEMLIEARRQAMREKNRLDAVIETLPVGICIFNEQRKKERVNCAFSDIWRIPKPPACGDSDDDCEYQAWWSETGKPVYPEEWASAQAIKEKKAITGLEFRIRRFNGEDGYILNSAAPILDDDGNITGCVTAVMDITKRKQAEERLKNFISVLSHEMRNPLSPILTEVELLKMRNNDADPDLKEAVGTIERQTNIMAELLKELLDVSRIARGKIELSRRKTDMVALIHTAMETSDPLISRAHQYVSFSFSGEEPIMADIDPLRVGQIITNILNNASKHSNENGVIEIHLEKQPNTIVVRVVDHGSGIPRGSIENIFELFTQNETTSRLKGGLGIGLFLSRELARLHGGTIIARSEGPGKGSEFVLTLPVRPPEKK